MESVVRPPSNIGSGPGGQHTKERCGNFQMPLHYPRYTLAEYQTMPEWKLDCLLKEYGLPITGDVEQKRYCCYVRSCTYIPVDLFLCVCLDCAVK
ncbi:hypothetical protein NC653_006737 [Populus alba x Populus x berolinensis]|uniref:DUF7722 domain-containing protein n=1 Tax=Populus alba x Populus x berolinensis TaxID=444605 RepID=A0AAD6RFP3_9ROSI|nr:hypothetical protein NC653_006737 [Populus alba x Populus x berolinensis]